MNTSLPAARAATLAQIASVLRRAQRVLAFCHISPDGDAIGSLLGLGWILRNLPLPPPAAARQIALVCADPLPPQLGFLPGAERLLTAAPAGPWDAIVAVDASDAKRLGGVFRPDDYGAAPIIVLDHHVTNLHFGALNYVEPRAAATAQVVVDLADALEVPITQAAAVCLLTGLVTDTLSFRTPNTTPEVMRTAARLMEAGADVAEITALALNRLPLAAIRLWALALAALQLDGNVLWTQVTPAMRQAAGSPHDGESGLAEYLLNAPEARATAVFSEKADGAVEISFRSRPGCDVAQIALSLGGGGHRQAAGCTVPGPLADALARVLPLLHRAAG